MTMSGHWTGCLGTGWHCGDTRPSTLHPGSSLPPSCWPPPRHSDTQAAEVRKSLSFVMCPYQSHLFWRCGLGVGVGSSVTKWHNAGPCQTLSGGDVWFLPCRASRS